MSRDGHNRYATGVGRAAVFGVGFWCRFLESAEGGGHEEHSIQPGPHLVSGNASQSHVAGQRPVPVPDLHARIPCSLGRLSVRAGSGFTPRNRVFTPACAIEAAPSVCGSRLGTSSPTRVRGNASKPNSRVSRRPVAVRSVSLRIQPIARTILNMSWQCFY